MLVITRGYFNYTGSVLYHDPWAISQSNFAGGRWLFFSLGWLHHDGCIFSRSSGLSSKCSRGSCVVDICCVVFLKKHGNRGMFQLKNGFLFQPNRRNSGSSYEKVSNDHDWGEPFLFNQHGMPPGLTFNQFCDLDTRRFHGRFAEDWKMWSMPKRESQ